MDIYKEDEESIRVLREYTHLFLKLTASVVKDSTWACLMLSNRPWSPTAGYLHLPIHVDSRNYEPPVPKRTFIVSQVMSWHYANGKIY